MKKRKKQNKHVGSSLDDFLKEEGILEEARTIAIKEAVAWQVQQAMLKGNITKVEMARRMRTSRAALDRLLDPGNGAVTLQTRSRAANAIGRDLASSLFSVPLQLSGGFVGAATSMMSPDLSTNGNQV